MRWLAGRRNLCLVNEATVISGYLSVLRPYSYTLTQLYGAKPQGDAESSRYIWSEHKIFSPKLRNTKLIQNIAKFLKLYRFKFNLLK